MRPTRTLLVTTAAAGLAVTASVVSTPAATANDRVLRLTARSTTSSLFIPCPTCVLASQPDGAHIGGTQIDAGDLLDMTGHKVGHYALQSVGVTPFTADGPGELTLNAILVIGTDQITATGIEEPPLNQGSAAITGGTGRYRSARGEIHYTDNPDDSTTLDIALNG
jgi:hypothetical protein